ncbi:MAG: hypothetical protein WAL47_14780 [Pyrinomonadaceae bacterium]
MPDRAKGTAIYLVTLLLLGLPLLGQIFHVLAQSVPTHSPSEQALQEGDVPAPEAHIEPVSVSVINVTELAARDAKASKELQPNAAPVLRANHPPRAEFQQRGYFVYRFYPVAFGRKPDHAEFVPDLASVSGFLDDNQLETAKVAFIANFMARPAFANTYNPLNNTQYVDTLLSTAAVTLSPATRQTLIDGLNGSTPTRARVLRQIVESAEMSAKYNHQAYALMEYFGYLRRQPDAFYLDWIAVLDQSNDPRGMVTGFVNSAEYRQRFGP